MNEFLASNNWQWRLLRTVVQGVLGVVIALELGLCERGLNARAFSPRTCQRARSLNARSLDLIMGWCVLDPSIRGLVVALGWYDFRYEPFRKECFLSERSGAPISRLHHF